MDDEFRYLERQPPMPTSSIVLWLMAIVPLAGSIFLGVELAGRDAADMHRAAREAANRAELQRATNGAAAKPPTTVPRTLMADRSTR